MTNILSVLIWVQTVCKGYQQTTKVSLARKELRTFTPSLFILYFTSFLVLSLIFIVSYEHKWHKEATSTQAVVIFDYIKFNPTFYHYYFLKLSKIVLAHPFIYGVDICPELFQVSYLPLACQSQFLLSAHLFCLYCKQYGTRSDCSLTSSLSLIRVHIVGF